MRSSPIMKRFGKGFGEEPFLKRFSPSFLWVRILGVHDQFQAGAGGEGVRTAAGGFDFHKTVGVVVDAVADAGAVRARGRRAVGDIDVVTAGCQRFRGAPDSQVAARVEVFETGCPLASGSRTTVPLGRPR